MDGRGKYALSFFLGRRVQVLFESADAIKAALSGEHAAEVIGDARNFTNAEPIIQINDRIAPGS